MMGTHTAGPFVFTSPSYHEISLTRQLLNSHLHPCVQTAGDVELALHTHMDSGRDPVCTKLSLGPNRRRTVPLSRTSGPLFGSW